MALVFEAQWDSCSCAEKWKLRTSSACTTDGASARIGGIEQYPELSGGLAACKAWCVQYAWCRGVRSGAAWCRLLTGDIQRAGLVAQANTAWHIRDSSGYKAAGYGASGYPYAFKWVEPSSWKTSTQAHQKCYERVGAYPLRCTQYATCSYVFKCKLAEDSAFSAIIF